MPTDELVEHGDTVRFGDIELEVIHLRGHTPGSVALLYRDPARHRTCSPATRCSPAARARRHGPSRLRAR